MIRSVLRDERETAVDLRADRIASVVLSFGLLAIVAYRAFALHEQAWDLLAFVIGSGVVATAYRIRQRAVSKALGQMVFVAAAVAALVAVLIGTWLGR